MLRVVFMGTPDFAVPVLHSIHSAHKIIAVYTQPDRKVGRGLDVKFSPVKTEALGLGLQVFQPEKLSTTEELKHLQALAPDIIVVVAYGQILRKDVLDLPRLGCVNIHSSLLPRWRGAAPIQRAILADDGKTGVTTMKMVEKLDAGDIFEQEMTTIMPNDTAGTLHDRLSQMGASLILSTLSGLENNSLKSVPQNEIGGGQVTIAAKLSKDMEWLDPSISAEVLERQVRALNPWPGTSIRILNKTNKDSNMSEKPSSEFRRIKIKQVKLWHEISGHEGQLFEKVGMLLFGTVKGSLELLEVQEEGKKAVSSAGFLNGLRGKGEKLPLQVMV